MQLLTCSFFFCLFVCTWGLLKIKQTDHVPGLRSELSSFWIKLCGYMGGAPKRCKDDSFSIWRCRFKRSWKVQRLNHKARAQRHQHKFQEAVLILAFPLFEFLNLHFWKYSCRVVFFACGCLGWEASKSFAFCATMLPCRLFPGMVFLAWLHWPLPLEQMP